MQVHLLLGGASANMHAIQFHNDTSYVIREITDQTWLKEEPDLLLQEKTVLQALASSDIPTPNFVATDLYGEFAEHPTLIMTKLTGAINQLPSTTEKMVERLAQTLIRIHEHKQIIPYLYSPYRTKTKLTIPSWTAHREKWQQLKNYIENHEAPPFTNVFIHRDFHLNNVLWENGKITGIVDWINSCTGPRYIDVAHCRWNLAMTHSVQLADYFLQTYNTYHTVDSYDVYWDILSLFDIFPGKVTVYKGWSHLPIDRLTREELYARMDAYALSLSEEI